VIVFFPKTIHMDFILILNIKRFEPLEFWMNRLSMNGNSEISLM